MLDPKSPQSLAISNLFIATLIISGVIFAIVAGLVIYIAIRFRGREGQAEPKQVFGQTRLEVGWTLGPLLLLGVIFVFTAQGTSNANPSEGTNVAPPNGKADLVVVGHQWWWEIGYPSAGITTANEIHLPTGKSFFAQLTAADVIHDLWIPAIGPKMDMLPAKINTLTLEADQTGTYLGACAEYCGAEHGKMLVRAIVQPQAEYDAWLNGQRQPAQARPTAADALKGQQLFQSKTCISCHAINGTGANAQVGPNLTHFAGRTTIATIMNNDQANLTAWLKDPQSIKPGAYMPNLQLSDGDVASLVAYLQTLK